MSRLKDVVVDLYTAPKHAQTCMKELGINYQLAVPQSIADCWWFFNCKNLPGQLPKWIKVRDFGDLNRLVGHGLSQTDADELMKEKKNNP